MEVCVYNDSRCTCRGNPTQNNKHSEKEKKQNHGDHFTSVSELIGFSGLDR